MIKRMIKLILIILWMGLIFVFSNDTGEVSTKKSDGFIIKLVELISGGDLEEHEKEKWTKYLVVPIRKGAHIAVYAVLGVLIFNFVLEFVGANFRGMLISILIVFAYACSDEIHQLFVKGRSGQMSDVLLDTLGACMGVFVFKIISKWFEQKNKKMVSDKK